MLEVKNCMVLLKSIFIFHVLSVLLQHTVEYSGFFFRRWLSICSLFMLS